MVASFCARIGDPCIQELSKCPSPNTDLIGRSMRELLGPIYPLNQPYIEGALRGERQDFEREIPDPAGGRPRHSAATYLPDIGEDGEVRGFFVLVSDITERKKMEDALIVANQQAAAALAQVKTLRGMLPICAWCRKVRDDNGYWGSIERYLMERTDATVTHGMCEACEAKLAGDT